MGFVSVTDTSKRVLVLVVASALLGACGTGQKAESKGSEPTDSSDVCESFDAALQVKGQEYNPMRLSKPLRRDFAGPPMEAIRCTTDDLLVNDEERSFRVDHPAVRRIKGMPARWVLFDTTDPAGDGVYVNAQWENPFDGTPKKLQALFMTGR